MVKGGGCRWAEGDFARWVGLKWKGFEEKERGWLPVETVAALDTQRRSEYV